MRERLSAKYTLWQKIPVAILLFAIILATEISGNVTSSLPDSAIVGILVLALSATLCIIVVRFIFKERTILEFDDDNLYIFKVKDQEQRSIPLSSIIRLDLRPRIFEIGVYWFWTFTLAFTNESDQEERIQFVMQVGKPSFGRFVTKVTYKNPEFQFKGWTFC